jgi:hypothetical protein
MDVVCLADEVDSGNIVTSSSAESVQLEVNCGISSSGSYEVEDHCSEDESSADVEESWDAVPAIPPEPCPLCGQVPCDWVTFGDDICQECDEMVDQKVPNKEIRFHAYRMYTRFRFGVLR